MRLKSESAEQLLVESLHIIGPWETWKIWTVWKNASDNGNFPTALVQVYNAKYVFKFPERCSPKTTGWTSWRSKPDKNKKFVSASKWGPTSLLFQWIQGGLSHKKSSRGLKLITHLCLVPWLRTSGAVTPFSLYVFMACTRPILLYLCTNICECSNLLVFTVFHRRVSRSRDVSSK